MGPAREDDYWKYAPDEDPELEGSVPSRSDTFHGARQQQPPQPKE